MRNDRHMGTKKGVKRRSIVFSTMPEGDIGQARLAVFN